MLTQCPSPSCPHDSHQALPLELATRSQPSLSSIHTAVTKPPQQDAESRSAQASCQAGPPFNDPAYPCFPHQARPHLPLSSPLPLYTPGGSWSHILSGTPFSPCWAHTHSVIPPPSPTALRSLGMSGVMTVFTRVQSSQPPGTHQPQEKRKHGENLLGNLLKQF